MLKRLLYVTPFALLPFTEGHRKRMMMTLDRIKRAGYEVDILFISKEYSWSERFDRDLFAEMKTLCSNFFHLHQSTPRDPIGDVYTIDEWWSDECDSFCRWIFSNNGYEAIFCNYVFMSKVFELVRYKARCLLETHDLFTDRKQMLLDNGLVPEFFYTSRAEERKGVRRADVVISIKDEEAEFYRRLTWSKVVTLPYVEAVQGTSARTPAGSKPAGPIIFGFFGSSNSLNVEAVRTFADYLATLSPEETAPFEVHLYGSVCNRLSGAMPPCMKVKGLLDTPGEFYSLVDCVVNFQKFSTGLKIKIAEALSFGAPLISLAHAFEGFGEPAHRAQVCATFDELVAEMRSAALDRDYLAEIARASETVERALTRRTEEAVERLFGEAETAPAMVFVVSPFHYNKSAAYRHVVSAFRMPFALSWSSCVFVPDDVAPSGEFRSFVNTFGRVLGEADLPAIAPASVVVILDPDALDTTVVGAFQRAVVVEAACDLVGAPQAEEADLFPVNSVIVRSRGLSPVHRVRLDETRMTLDVALFRWMPWELSLVQRPAAFKSVEQVWIFSSGVRDDRLDALLRNIAAPLPLRIFSESFDLDGAEAPRTALASVFDAKLIPRGVIVVGECARFALALEWLSVTGIEIRQMTLDHESPTTPHSGFLSRASSLVSPFQETSPVASKPLNDWTASGWGMLAGEIGHPLREEAE